jgi:hypothetical protein
LPANMTPLERTECKKYLHRFFSSSEGRQVGRLITAERSKGKNGNTDARMNEICDCFRRLMVDLYMQPEPRQL